MEWIQKYEKLVKTHPKDVHMGVESLSMLTFFIPGRFGSVEIIGEASYVLLNLLHLYNGRILDPERHLNGGVHWQWHSALTILQEGGVVAEMLALSRGGEEKRWGSILLIEIVKAVARARLLFTGGSDLNRLGIRLLAEGGRFSPAAVPNAPSQRRKSNSVSSTRAHVQQWRRDRSPNSSLANAACLVALSKAKKLLLLGEVLHVFRPVVYVLFRRRMGGKSWIPWLLSCIVDLFSMRCSTLGEESCKRIVTPVLTTDRNTTVRAELRRRQALLLMYFMRDPLYGILTGRVASSALGTLSRIPLLGFFFEYFLEMLEYMKRYYFFWSGS